MTGKIIIDYTVVVQEMVEDKAGGGLWLPGWISGGSATQSKILGAGFINALLSYHSRFHQFKIKVASYRHSGCAA